MTTARFKHDTRWLGRGRATVPEVPVGDTDRDVTDPAIGDGALGVTTG